MSIQTLPQKGLTGRTLPVSALPTDWVRNPNWLTLPSVAGQQRLVGLIAVYQDSNFLAFTCSGNYTVDWGDGVVENINAGVQANHQYDFNNVLLNGTDTGLNYKQAIVVITPNGGNLTSINLNVKHNQPSLSSGYVSAWLDIAIEGQFLTTLSVGGTSFTTVTNLLERFSLTGTNSITSIAGLFATCKRLRSIPSLNTGVLTNTSTLFQGCTALTVIPPLSTASVTTMLSMFDSCSKLLNAPLLDTSSCTNFSLMFSGCTALQTVPLYNFGAATAINCSLMFSSCSSLTSIPKFNTAKVTSFTNMFALCTNLQSIPSFNTSAATNITSMFSSCFSLRSVPLLDTSLCTSFSGVFTNCYALTSVPLFNTANVTTFANAFSGCRSLITVPLFNTALVTDFTNAFLGCSALTSVPLLNTGAGINFTGMFNGVHSLDTLPLFNTANGTNFSSFVGLIATGGSGISTLPRLNLSNSTNNGSFWFNQSNCSQATFIGTKATISYTTGKLSLAALEDIFNNLGVGTSQTITISNNWGAVSPVAVSSVNGTAGSTTLTMANTTGIAIGNQCTGTGLPITTPVACTFTTSTSRVGLTAHGLSINDPVSFATIVTTTGIVINTIYYVQSTTANDFTISATVGGAALTLTSNGTGTLRFAHMVTAITPNVSVTLNRALPAAVSAASISFRPLKTHLALLRGWACVG